MSPEVRTGYCCAPSFGGVCANQMGHGISLGRSVRSRPVPSPAAFEPPKIVSVLSPPSVPGGAGPAAAAPARAEALVVHLFGTYTHIVHQAVANTVERMPYDPRGRPFGPSKCQCKNRRPTTSSRLSEVACDAHAPWLSGLDGTYRARCRPFCVSPGRRRPTASRRGGRGGCR